VIWNAKPQNRSRGICRAAFFQGFQGAALIDLEVVGDLGVIVWRRGFSVAAVIAFGGGLEVWRFRRKAGGSEVGAESKLEPQFFRF